MLIAVTNQSAAVMDAEVQAMLPALQHQANYHFRPYWDTRVCTLLWYADPAHVPAAAAHLVFLDDSDQAGALGYHDFTEANQPVLKVFAGTDKAAGLSISVTASHEILEAIADPDVSRGYQVTATRWYALEVCDAVEADQWGYTLDGVLVSDFQLPAWFRPWRTALQYDYMGHCKQPLELLEGGYASYWEGNQWHEFQKRSGAIAPVPVGASACSRDRSTPHRLFAHTAAEGLAELT